MEWRLLELLSAIANRASAVGAEKPSTEVLRPSVDLATFFSRPLDTPPLLLLLHTRVVRCPLFDQGLVLERSDQLVRRGFFRP